MCFLVIVSIQTVVIWFAHAFLKVLQSCSRLCPFLDLSSLLQRCASTCSPSTSVSSLDELCAILPKSRSTNRRPSLLGHCTPQPINDSFVVDVHHRKTDTFPEETQESRQLGCLDGALHQSSASKVPHIPCIGSISSS